MAKLLQWLLPKEHSSTSEREWKQKHSAAAAQQNEKTQTKQGEIKGQVVLRVRIVTAGCRHLSVFVLIFRPGNEKILKEEQRSPQSQPLDLDGQIDKELVDVFFFFLCFSVSVENVVFMQPLCP